MKKINFFDEYANKYDSWFFENTNLLTSEVRLVAHFLKDCGNTLSVGCGSGLFESILKKEFDIEILNGIEPATGMAEIARKRGMNVEIVSAEDAEFGNEIYDTILFNGTPSYIFDLEKTFNKAYKALKKGGKIIVLDVPKESNYGTLYNLAKLAGTWNHEFLKGITPNSPYPIEFVNQAIWRTTTEMSNILLNTGFSDLKYAQTLTKHPIYSNNESEYPQEGYDKGDYVAICAIKKV